MNDEASKEWVGTAWTRYLRNEAIREKAQAVGLVCTVGVWLATFADPSGENAFPSRETLSNITGQSIERVGRALAVLVALGLVVQKRRPNLTPAYTLLMPVGRLDWGAHIHLFTETRDKKKHAAAKAKTVAEALERQKSDSEHARVPYAARTPGTLAVRTASVPGVPDSEHARVPPTLDSERARYRTASTLAVRTASAPGGDQSHLLTEDQSPDHHRVAVGPQGADAGAAARARAEARMLEDAEIIRKVMAGEKLMRLERIRYQWLQAHGGIPEPRIEKTAM